MASETTFDHWKVVFLMSKSEKKGPEAMKPLLRHSICQHDLKTVVRNKLLHFWQDQIAPTVDISNWFHFWNLLLTNILKLYGALSMYPVFKFRILCAFKLSWCEQSGWLQRINCLSYKFFTIMGENTYPTEPTAWPEKRNYYLHLITSQLVPQNHLLKMSYYKTRPSIKFIKG